MVFNQHICNPPTLKSALLPDLQKVEVVHCVQKLLHLTSPALQLSDFQLQL